MIWSVYSNDVISSLRLSPFVRPVSPLPRAHYARFFFSASSPTLNCFGLSLGRSFRIVQDFAPNPCPVEEFIIPDNFSRMRSREDCRYLLTIWARLRGRNGIEDSTILSREFRTHDANRTSLPCACVQHKILSRSLLMLIFDSAAHVVLGLDTNSFPCLFSEFSRRLRVSDFIALLYITTYVICRKSIEFRLTNLKTLLTTSLRIMTLYFLIFYYLSSRRLLRCYISKDQ